MDSSHAQTSTCSVVSLRMAKLSPRQHAPASESVSLADSVPGQGWDAALDAGVDELKLTKRAEEWTALINSHSVRPPLFLLS